MNKEPLVLSVGDLVVYKQVRGARPSWNDGELHIIQEAHASESGLTYTTNRGAWFRRTDFDLVEDSNEVLLDILFAEIVFHENAAQHEEDEDWDESALPINRIEWREPEPKAIRRTKYDL